MNEYLEAQIKLFRTLRITLRTLGLIAGFSAIATPFLLIPTLGSSTPSLGNALGGLILMALVLFVVFLGAPIGINFMFLAIALRSRMADLRIMQSATDDSAKFVGLLAPYLKKIRTHRVILWVWAGFLVFFGFLGNYRSYQDGPNFNFAVAFLLLAGVHLYLGFVLSKQVKDLTPSLSA